MRSRITVWERIYLAEGPEGFRLERRERGSNGSKGSRRKGLKSRVEEDLLAEVQRLRQKMITYKICKPWFWDTSTASRKKRR